MFYNISTRTYTQIIDTAGKPGVTNTLAYHEQSQITTVKSGPWAFVIKKKFYNTDTQAQCYKTFFVRNLRIFVIS